MESVCDAEMFWTTVSVASYLFLTCKANHKPVTLHINTFIILPICWTEFAKRTEDAAIKAGGYLEEKKSKQPVTNNLIK